MGHTQFRIVQIAGYEPLQLRHVVGNELARLGQIPFGDLSDGLSQLVIGNANLPVLAIHLTLGIYVVKQNLSLLRFVSAADHANRQRKQSQFPKHIDSSQ